MVQTTTASVPANTVLIVKNPGLTIPFPIVIATAVPVIAHAKSQKAAIIMATLGERVRVPITVAIEFAASFKPLVKPKPIATIIIRIKKANGSGMF
jgi:hypothetical protein